MQSIAKSACSVGLWAAVALVPTAASAAAPVPDEVAALARSSGCLACHGLVRKQVGPGFAQIAARYASRPDAPDYLAGRLRNGAVGNWGRVIMPRQAHMSEAESLALARWVLARPAP